MPLDLTSFENAVARLREGAEIYARMPGEEMIRSGCEQGLLLGDWPRWKAYREMRAKTSHTYDERVALEVVGGIGAFLAEAEFLRDQLRARAP